LKSEYILDSNAENSIFEVPAKKSSKVSPIIRKENSLQIKGKQKPMIEKYFK
jgi:hypothetical protein